MNARSESCSSKVEDVFGPVVAESCLNGFDFTLLFEEAILTILPLGIALFVATWRLVYLRKGPTKVQRSWLFISKLAVFTVHVVLRLCLLVLWENQNAIRTRLSATTAFLELAGSLIFLNLSILEHLRSIHPSTLLASYLGLSIVLDLARVRTLFFVPGPHVIAKCNLVCFFVKTGILALELLGKRSLVMRQWYDASPEATSGIYNKILFTWLNRLLFKGFRGSLTLDSLPALSHQILSASQPAALIDRWRKANKSNNNALLWTFIVQYKWDILIVLPPRLANAAFLFAEPFLVQRVLNFTSSPDQRNRDNIAYGLIAAYGLVLTGKGISLALTGHFTNRLSTKFRGSLITLIFSKTLRLSATAGSNAEAMTLMSADIDRIDRSLNIIHMVITSAVELVLSIWLLYRLLGVSMVPSSVYAVICLLVGMPIAAAAGKAQIPWLEAIERRLDTTSRVLGSMKAIRMTGLTSIVSRAVAGLRVSEIRASYRHRILNVVDSSIYYVSADLIRLIAFGTYSILARAHGTEALTQGVAFASLSLFALQEQPLMILVSCFDYIQTLIGSFKRVQRLLVAAEQEDPRTLYGGEKGFSEDLDSWSEIQGTLPRDSDGSLPSKEMVGSSCAITLNNTTVGYVPEQRVLKGISLSIPSGRVTMVVGPVGSGKSTLLKTLLGEVPDVMGSVSTPSTNFAYCPQSPWIIWGTIRDNIIGMAPWDEAWYKTVLDACCLSKDLESLPDGDQTKTGSRGSRLSGGQRTRVSLARALYSRLPTMILDDPMTGLDRTTERSVLDALFGPAGMLRYCHTTVVLATNTAAHLHYADHVIVLDKGCVIAEQGPAPSIAASGCISGLLQSPSPTYDSEPEIEQHKDGLEEFGLSELDKEQSDSRRTGDIAVYSYYIRVAGRRLFFVYLFMTVVCALGTSFPAIWLQWWTAANEDHPNDRLGYWYGGYAGITGVAIMTCIVSDWMMGMVLVPTVAQRFHDLLLKTTMRAKISLLTSTASGNTTNRFSQDLELIDNDLPRALEPVILGSLNILISVVLVCAGSGYVAAAIPGCVLVVYLVQFFYLRTSRQLRLLDIEAKAPLFSQFLETSEGIACIRAYGWTEFYLERSYKLLDDSQKPFFLLKSIQKWLTLVLDLMVASLAVLLVAFATTVRGASIGFLGVALFSIINFSTELQSLVEEWTQLETAIGAVNRVRSYARNTEPEDKDDDGEDEKPGMAAGMAAGLENWPRRGAVSFNNVSASYQSENGPVLKQISLSFQAGDKVAICGRTGSGKSSLVSALLRMLDTDSGSISVDGVDIRTIPRQVVRRQLNTLPQEPFFLQGTVRENVDPLHMADDEAIMSALEAVELLDLINSRGGLDAEMDAGLLSHGQQQLFCLARAIAKPSQIIIMDEATSSVDATTDALMQSIIRSKFKGRTVIAIAHKLDSILDFDHVAVLERGSLLEFGNPQSLLGTPSSHFRSLFMSMGFEVPAFWEGGAERDARAERHSGGQRGQKASPEVRRSRDRPMSREIRISREMRASRDLDKANRRRSGGM